MNTIYKHFLLIIGVLVLSLTSCEDFLDREPLDQVGPNQFLSSESDLASFPINYYSSLFSTHGGWSTGIGRLDDHTANRGENIAIIFINNAIYGMTGGQMAPTTLEDMKTSTSPFGRDTSSMGRPLKILDMLAQLDGVCLASRTSVHTAAAVKKTKRLIKLAFENSMAGKGTSIVEVVSTCNSGWKMTPAAANDWMVENMFPVFPLGDLKNV
jgi:pyruvate/2-oxoacid:ferredoxin oxidoreductase beta subunit